MSSVAEEAWLSMFPVRIRSTLLGVRPEVRRCWQEVRTRTGQPILVLHPSGEMWLSPYSPTTPNAVVTGEDLQDTFQLMTQHSVYAIEEELRCGFITLPGGHRLGFTGHAVLENGRIRLLRQISSLNLRLARAVTGIGERCLPSLIASGRVLSTLILSPPGCGKTTLLRDLVRLISRGAPELGLSGQQVSLVDERSEVAGTYLGQAQLDVGPRTDVLDGGPKAEGMLLMLRAMSPQVLATDEIGQPADADAVAEAAKAGVTVLATAHADSPEEAGRRPTLAALLANGYFQRLVVLDASQGPGTVRGIFARGQQSGAEVTPWSGSWVPCSSWPARVVSAI